MDQPKANSYYKINGVPLSQKSVVKKNYTKDEKTQYKSTAENTTSYIAGTKAEDAMKFLTSISIPYAVNSNTPVWAPSGYLPSFNTALWDNIDATAEDQIFQLKRTDQSLTLTKNNSNVGKAWTAANFDDGVVPYVVVLVIQASGGGGAPSEKGWTFWRYHYHNGGGGGGGGCWIAMLNLSAASTWSIKLGKQGATQASSEGAQGIAGGDCTVVGGSSGTVTISAGRGGTQSAGGAGGSVFGPNTNSSYYYTLLAVGGGQGGSPETTAGRPYPNKCIGSVGGSGTATVPGSTSSTAAPGGSGGTPRNAVGDSGGWGGGGGGSPWGNGGSAGWCASGHESATNFNGGSGSKGSGGGGGAGGTGTGSVGGSGFIKIYY